MVYISTQNMALSMRQSVMQTQSDLATARQEVSTGVYADLGLQLGAQTSSAISLSQQSGRLTALTNANVAASTRLTSTASSIDTIMSAAQDLSNTLVANASTGTLSLGIQTQASSSLQSMISALNTSVAGQYIFAGTNTASAPMDDITSHEATANTALTSDLAGLAADPSQITGAQMPAYLSDPTTAFGSLYQASGFSALSSASNTAITSQVSPGQTVKTSVSSTEAGFRNIAQAYAMLNGLADKGLNQDASQAVVTAATKLLNTGLASLTNVEAGVGTVQDTITNANTQMAAQQTILTDNVGTLENVDAYTLSTKVTALQTQLQDAYSLTSQLKSLSLVNYLTGG